MATNGQTHISNVLAAEDKVAGELFEDGVELLEDGLELREDGVEQLGVNAQGAPRVVAADTGSRARRGVVARDTARMIVETSETQGGHVMTTSMTMPMMIIMMEAQRSCALCVRRLLTRNFSPNI